MHRIPGQRKDLGIDDIEDGIEKPWHMVSRDIENSILIVTQNRGHPCLMPVDLITRQLHWVDCEPFTDTMRYTVGTHYRQADIPRIVKVLDAGRIGAIFDRPIAVATPGQSAVFYNDEVRLGSDITEQRLPLSV